MMIGERHDQAVYSGDPAAVLADALSDNMTPDGVRAVVDALRAYRPTDRESAQELEWLTEVLEETLGEG